MSSSSRDMALGAFDAGKEVSGTVLDLLAVMVGSVSGTVITLRSFPHSFPALLDTLESATTAVSSSIS